MTSWSAQYPPTTFSLLYRGLFSASAATPLLIILRLQAAFLVPSFLLYIDWSMSYSIPWAGQLALRHSTQRCFKLLPFRSTTSFFGPSSKLFHSQTPFPNQSSQSYFPLRQTKRPPPIRAISQQLRCCSTHHKMCKMGETAGATPLPDREVLPTNVKPIHYDLTMEPDFKAFKYNGTVTIE